MKKGQGLSLNTIIIAAIVLIVLIVLWAIFTGRMGAFTGGLKTQTEQTCDAPAYWSTTGACEAGEIIVPITDPAHQNEICCKEAGT